MGSPLTLFMALGIFLILLYPTTKAFLARRLIREQEMKLDRELSQLEKEEQKAREGHEASQDPAYQELEARRNHGLKKPGEEVIVIVPVQEERQETSDMRQGTAEVKGWWATIFPTFKDWFR